jgi:hypothetical protein
MSSLKEIGYLFFPEVSVTALEPVEELKAYSLLDVWALMLERCSGHQCPSG